MSPWAQLVSVGLVWMSCHCAGMCGPIVIGLDVAGAARGLRPRRGAARILAYQAGRMTTLGALGALAGLVGRGLAEVFTAAGAVLALVLAIVLVGRTMLKARAAPAAVASPAPGATTTPVTFGRRARRASLVTRLTRWLRAPSLSSSLGAAWRMGVVLGFMPCMIVAWALGLAAVSASPLTGAGIMLTLVAMTTPMLLGVTLLPRLVPRRWLPGRALALVSATWLALVGLAGLGIVGHAHVAVGDYTLMLW